MYSYVILSTINRPTHIATSGSTRPIFAHSTTWCAIFGRRRVVFFQKVLAGRFGWIRSTSPFGPLVLFEFIFHLFGNSIKFVLGRLTKAFGSRSVLAPVTLCVCFVCASRKRKREKKTQKHKRYICDMNDKANWVKSCVNTTVTRPAMVVIYKIPKKLITILIKIYKDWKHVYECHFLVQG